MARTLLVVEDEEDIHEYFVFLFSDRDIELIPARDGAAALEIIDRGTPIDAILLDVMLPVMSGEEFLRVLREERGSAVPVIVCTVDENLARRAREMGEVQGVFIKGRPGNELIALVEEVLGA